MAATRIFCPPKIRPDIYCWGDSMAFRLTGNTYCAKGQANYGAMGYSCPRRRFIDRGFGGETATQVAARHEEEPACYGSPHIIWVCRNGLSSVEDNRAAVSSMVSRLTTTQYVLLSVTNGAVAGDLITDDPSYYQTLRDHNAWLEETFPGHYLDVLTPLIASYDAGIPQDVTDNTNGVVPTSCRSDTVHLREKGQVIVSDLVAAYIFANWEPASF